VDKPELRHNKFYAFPNSLPSILFFIIKVSRITTPTSFEAAPGKGREISRRVVVVATEANALRKASTHAARQLSVI
jgi:hypothetical protein